MGNSDSTDIIPRVRDSVRRTSTVAKLQTQNKLVGTKKMAIGIETTPSISLNRKVDKVRIMSVAEAKSSAYVANHMAVKSANRIVKSAPCRTAVSNTEQAPEISTTWDNEGYSSGKEIRGFRTY